MINHIERNLSSFFGSNVELLNLTKITEVARRHQQLNVRDKEQIADEIFSGFESYLSHLNLTPLLCELALISDKSEFVQFGESRKSTKFISLIKTYNNSLFSQTDGALLKRSWLKAIKRLESAYTTNGKANFIVLNKNTYNRFLFKIEVEETMSSMEDQSKDAPVNREMEGGDSQSSYSDITVFELGETTTNSSEETLTQSSIKSLMSNTISNLPHEIRVKLNQSKLFIFPFSRTLEIDGDNSLLRSPRLVISEDELNDRSTCDPAGCFFIICKADKDTSNGVKLNVNEERLTNYIQYVLTRSSLVESRNNLIRYEKELTSRNFGQYLHQFNSIITNMQFLYEQALDATKGGVSLTNAVSKKVFDSKKCRALASEGFEYMQRIAFYSSKLAKGEVNHKQKEAMLETTIYSRVESEIRATIESYTSRHTEIRELENLKFSNSFKWSKLEFAELSKFIGKNEVSGLSDIFDEARSLKWIGECFAITAQELATNIIKHASNEDENGNIHCDAYYSLVHNEETIYLWVANKVEGYDAVRECKKLIDTKSPLHISSTGLAQIRLSLSPLPSSCPAVKNYLTKSDHGRFYSIVIPVGVYV